jgi:hypothetical protein
MSPRSTLYPIRILLPVITAALFACSSSREPNTQPTTTVASVADSTPVGSSAAPTEQPGKPAAQALPDDSLHYRLVHWRDVSITVRVRGNQESELSIKIDKPNEDLPEFATAWNGHLLGQVLVADLNQNNEPEIYLSAVDKGKLEFAEFRAYERGTNNFTRFDLPELTEKQRGGYRGGDLFWFDNLTICRAIKIYRTQDLDGKPTGGERRIYYKADNIPSLSFAGMQAMERQ